mmetsp:Transcript_14548/g.24650  ORF Transcript_14548/g.24650 Transcript_14548/m.24650 type:complete len:801 (+) Transcript_14548:440-2842(+)
MVLPAHDPETGHAPHLPGFEGSEKRLEVDFYGTQDSGLRRLSRSQLDDICTLAECEIVSDRHNAHFDAYVLSESSLFVYPTKLVIKTCGTTKLLSCVDKLLEFTSGLGMLVKSCKYSRACYKFPSFQPKVHQTFDEETKALDASFHKEPMLGKGFAHILGDGRSGLQWHVYLNQATRDDPMPQSARLTVEVCMTGLDQECAARFYHDRSLTAKAATLTSGIRALFPTSEIDDFLFEPCGYSMNGLDQEGFSTIHITPQDGFSYASVEICGYTTVDVSDVVERVHSMFKPAQLVVALSTDSTQALGAIVKATPLSPKGLDFEGTVTQQDVGKFAVAYYRFFESPTLDGPVRSDSPKCSTPPLDDPSERIKRTFSDAVIDTNPSNVKRARVSPPADGFNFGQVMPIATGRAALNTFCRFVAKENPDDEAFYVTDLGVARRQLEDWWRLLPRVEPFYAVKCMPDAGLLAMLAKSGCSFDCASPVEVKLVMQMGVAADRIIYANPAKPVRHIQFAKEHGVRMTTFDSEHELQKLAQHFPNASCILRIKADDPTARCPLGTKYGALQEEIVPLLKAALRLNLNVVGVSFHVGSGATDPAAFPRAVSMAKAAFDVAGELGLTKFTLLDIGGGFSGMSADADGVALSAVAEAINSSLEKFFPESEGVRVISEPGRYIAEPMATLCTHVFSKRVRDQLPADADAAPSDTREYWIMDGMYGSFNCILYDHAVVAVRPLFPKDEAPTFPTTLYGPTCDGLDTVMRGVALPDLQLGEWLGFDNMGAYTRAAGSTFNGYDTADIKTYYVDST